MRILALDYGTARCGCAISDPTGTLARPLPVLEPPAPRGVADLVSEHDVRLSGEVGPQAAAARQFRDEVAALVEVPVETYDERLTTRMAERTARSGASAAEDSLAAAHLLESYLQARGTRGTGTEEEG